MAIAYKAQQLSRGRVYKLTLEKPFDNVQQRLIPFKPLPIGRGLGGNYKNLSKEINESQLKCCFRDIHSMLKKNNSTWPLTVNIRHCRQINLSSETKDYGQPNQKDRHVKVISRCSN